MQGSGMYTNNHNAAGASPVVRSLLWLVVALGGLFAGSTAQALDTGDIIVTSLKGEVHVTMNGAVRTVRAGGVLELPASIKTGRDGAIELKQGATTVSVGPETLLEFPALDKPGGAIDRIVQPRGNAFYSIGKRDGHKLRVETPYLVGVIKGTQFNVAAADESTTISLFEGLLEVHATDDSAVVDLKAGEIASRKRGDKSISVIKMDGGKMPTPPARASSGDSGSNGNGTTPGTSTSAGTSAPSNSDGDSRGVIGGAGSVVPAVIDAVSSVVASTGSDLSAELSVRNNGPLGAITALEVNANVANIADVSTSTSLSVGVTGVDVVSNTSLDAGVASVNVGAAANVDLGSPAVDASVTAGVVAGPVGVDLGTTAAVDVSSGTVDTSATTSVAGVDAGVSAAANVATGTVDLGVTIAGVDLNAGVDLGLADNSATTTDTGSTTTTPGTDTVTNVVTDVGGLLDSLFRRPGRK
jgi:hypothetical protein